MPRPADGYRNRAGQQIPGVHDITNAYMPKPALVGWAYNRGKQGLPLYEKGTLDIGTTVHAMAELDLKGQPSREIEACARSALSNLADVAKAWSAYEAFTRWREVHAVRSIAHEVTIVSEKHQLGGTPDCVAFVGGEIGLLDFKTCSKVPKEPYHEQLMAMAAHAVLWNEQYPDRLIRSCHLIYLPKDGSYHKHHAYADIARQWKEFRYLLAAFAAKNGTPKPLDARDAEIAKLRAEITRANVAAPKPRVPHPARSVARRRKPAPAQLLLPPPIALPPPLSEPMTMGQLLRAYGHIPKG
jgi:hypothetical protein